MLTLQDLVPARKSRVIDLVRKAGVNVDDWSNYKNGEKNPGAHPTYCYEWAFVQPGEVVVLNLWHGDMEVKDGGIEYKLNPRKYRQEKVKTSSPKYHRAERLEAAIRAASDEGLPIRVIVLKRNDNPNLEARPTASSKRGLDGEVWHVKLIDEGTGQIILRRGPAGPRVVDQFSVVPDGSDNPGRHETTGVRIDRSREVRQYVLQRSNGKCEYCGELGFKLKDGRIYVETHHIIPLSGGGPDTVANVAALCANHHREAHYGETASLIAAQLRVAGGNHGN